MFSRSFFLYLSIAILACTVSVQAADEWVEVRSPHFSVVTDGGQKRGRGIALRFEQMRSVFGNLLLKDRINTPVPLQIIGFRNSRELRQFAPLWKGKPITVAGLFQSGPDRNFILLDLSSEDPYQVVFHEYAHLLLNGNYPPTQPWFDEGFAEYYSTIKVTKNSVQIGVPPESASYVLRESSFFHTVDLFSVKQDSAAYNEDGDHRSMFYAQSWLVVHYLFDKQKLKELGTYFDLTRNQHMPIPEALQKVFGMDSKQFDHEIEQFYRGNMVKGYTFDLPEMETLSYTVQPLSPLDAQAVLADTHLHSPDYGDKAITEFQQILTVNPNHAASHRGLGYAYLYKNDFTNAAQHFRRAAQLDTRDPRVLYYSALLMNKEALAGGTQLANAGEMRTELEQSIKLDPQFADAYNLLAYVQAVEGSPEAALETAKTAIKLSPRNEGYWLNYGHLLMTANKWEDAETVFTRLKNSDDAQIRAAAESNLQVAAQMKDRSSIVSLRDEKPRYSNKQWGTPKSQPVVAASKSETGSSDDNYRGGTVVSSTPDEPVKIDKRPISFLKGTLLSVSCSPEGSAILNVGIPRGPHLKLWQMSTADRYKLVLMGADNFSCEWKSRKVAINYRQIVDGKGELVSLELQ